MEKRAGPPAHSRRIALALRRFRRGSGQSGAEVAAALGVSASRVSRWETAAAGIRVEELERLLDHYRVPPPSREALLDAARRAVGRGGRGDRPEWVDFEEDAAALRNYEPLLVPALLQTAEYARAIIRETGPELSHAEVDAATARRMARQNTLTRTKPALLDVLVDQSVLDRPFGDPGTHRRQLRRLADLAELPNVSVRVIPTAAGLHPGLTGPFAIVDHVEETSLVLLETRLSTVVLDDEERVEAFEKTWNALGDRAFSTAKTETYLRGRR